MKWYNDTPKDFAEQSSKYQWKTSPSPPGGWLTLACFQVQWSKNARLDETGSRYYECVAVDPILEH